MCECGAPWHSHVALLDAAPTSATILTSNVPVPQPPPPQPPCLGSSAPPFNVFQGVPAPALGSIGTQRLTSIARTLPHGPFAAASSRHSGPRHAYPGGAAPTTASVTVMTWPLVVQNSDYEPPGYPAPPITVQNSRAKRYTESFQKHGLLFDVDVLASDTANVASFNTDIMAKLAGSQLSFPQPPSGTIDGAPGDLDSQLWTLLQPRVCQDKYNFNIHPSINDNTFGYKEFKSLNKKFANPLSTSKPWIWIAPRFGHIVGPITSFSTPDIPLTGLHPCFGWRVLDTLPPATAARRDDPIQADCYAGYCPTNELVRICPSSPMDSLPIMPIASTSAPQRAITPPSHTQALIRQRSPTSQIQDTERRVRPRQQSTPEPRRPILSLPQPSPMQQQRPVSATAAHPLGVDVLEPRKVAQWAASFRHDSPQTPAIPNLHIHSRTFLGVAKCLLDIIGPVLSPTNQSLPDRLNTFRAHGAFLALHCCILQHGPLPISIWVLLALIGGRNTMLVPKNILLHMDPAAYNILAPWYDFQQDTPMPPMREASHPLRLFLYEYMPDIQPSLISDVHTKAEHDGWLVGAFSLILLGHANPWNHPEFVALQEGFDLDIQSAQFTQRIRSLCALPFLIAIYDRRVKTVEDISSHLRFHIATRASDMTTAYFAKLFELRLQNYIHGVGHPLQLRMLEVSEDKFTADRNNPLLRSNLILGAASDSDMCPTDDDWEIMFTFNGHDTRTSVVGRASSWNSVLGTPLSFHSCTLAIDVSLDRALREILLEAPGAADDRRSSEFDVWIHSQFLNREHNST
ncbi:hypothetical protein C8R44DRAFT_725469 [Mycena epipterygia]|nr:hypothetical protein C8R44DRAFT_725469 [Mycena epipterygia]